MFLVLGPVIRKQNHIVIATESHVLIFIKKER